MILVQEIHSAKADALWVALIPADPTFPPLLLLFQDGRGFPYGISVATDFVLVEHGLSMQLKRTKQYVDQNSEDFYITLTLHMVDDPLIQCVSATVCAVYGIKSVTVESTGDALLQVLWGRTSEFLKVNEGASK
jgi:ABC-type uncharacterized transport system involved in gliding motility auxiliary subunit